MKGQENKEEHGSKWGEGQNIILNCFRYENVPQKASENESCNDR